MYFPARGETKLDLARYYISVGDGIVRALRERPCMMHRFPSGVAGEKVYQKRVPHGAPPWLETVRVDFPRYGRHADELCVTELASVVWAVQMSTVEFHPWNSRRADSERPDEWRIDLDPMPRCDFTTVRRAAHIAQDTRRARDDRVAQDFRRGPRLPYGTMTRGTGESIGWVGLKLAGAGLGLMGGAGGSGAA